MEEASGDQDIEGVELREEDEDRVLLLEGEEDPGGVGGGVKVLLREMRLREEDAREERDATSSLCR